MGCDLRTPRCGIVVSAEASEEVRDEQAKLAADDDSSTTIAAALLEAAAAVAHETDKYEYAIHESTRCEDDTLSAGSEDWRELPWPLILRQGSKPVSMNVDLENSMSR